MAIRYELTRAEADILTAGLRTNPILNASGQYVPYGEYSAQARGAAAASPSMPST